MQVLMFNKGVDMKNKLNKRKIRIIIAVCCLVGIYLILHIQMAYLGGPYENVSMTYGEAFFY